MLPCFQSSKAQHRHHPLAWVGDGDSRTLGHGDRSGLGGAVACCQTGAGGCQAAVTSVMSEAVLCLPRSIPLIPLSPSARNGLRLGRVGWIFRGSARVSFPKGENSTVLVKDVTSSRILPESPGQHPASGRVQGCWQSCRLRERESSSRDAP